VLGLGMLPGLDRGTGRDLDRLQLVAYGFQRQPRRAHRRVHIVAAQQAASLADPPGRGRERRSGRHRDQHHDELGRVDTGQFRAPFAGADIDVFVAAVPLRKAADLVDAVRTRWPRPSGPVSRGAVTCQSMVGSVASACRGAGSAGSGSALPLVCRVAIAGWPVFAD